MERHLVEQIRIHYDLYVPPNYSKRRKYPLLIALHGYGGTKDSMMKLARRINGDHWLIASVQGPNAFIIQPGHYSKEAKTGFGWAARYKHEEAVALHHEILLDLVEDVGTDYLVDKKRLFLLGFSQSVALNYRFICTYPKYIRGVVAVCGGIPGDQQRVNYLVADTEVLHVATDQDEFYPLDQVKAFMPWLEQHTLSAELKVYKDKHVFPRRSLNYISRWISQRV
jgi:phospholipase/carboxylesterase